MPLRTEDQVRNEAGITLGFIDASGNNVDTSEYLSGVGQLTTFIQLGSRLGTTDFAGISDKPDGWLMPFNQNGVAIVLETKSEKEDISKKKWEKELKKNIEIMQKHYSKVAGILYNGKDCRVFMNFDEVASPAATLQRLEYYTRLFIPDTIDKGRIYDLTMKINNCLHKEFGVKNLNHRMIFTACALVAVKEGAILHKGTEYSLFHQTILNQLSKSLKEAKKQNEKLDLLCEVYSEIKMNTTDNQEAIDNFIDWITEISELINSDKWNGEDVMAIFFNEFNRYKGKSERGQVFTPDHITSFMYRLIDVSQSDVILDAACGSGAFLVKSMCNMIKDAGGINTKKAKEIKSKQLYGIEFDREIYALACANMLIHKDGKTNLEQLDSRKEDAVTWIRNISVKLDGETQAKGVTKVLMNPPFERVYGCMTIVKNVLDNVPIGTQCAFILPDKKLEKDLTDKKFGNKVLKDHRLTTIVKLPEKIFTGVTASVFVFEAGKPQNGQNIIGYYIEEDGLETVKNQGRQDIKNRWPAIEDYWIRTIHDGSEEKYKTRQIIDPKEHLSYQMPQADFVIYEHDFMKTMMDYEMYKQGVDVKSFKESLAQRVLYSDELAITNGSNEDDSEESDLCDTSTWKNYLLGGDEGLFDIVKGKRLTKANMKYGDVKFIGSSAENNGVTNHIGNKENRHPGNLITVAYNGSVGETFYQEEEFIASDDVNVLYPRFEMNKYIALFICPIIRTVGKNYEFIDKWKKEIMEKDTIMLPANSDGTPDFAYMEQYMKNLEEKVILSLSELQVACGLNMDKINTSKWKDFQITKFFDLSLPKGDLQVKKVTDGDVPLITPSNSNNGLLQRISSKSKSTLYKAHSLTVDMFGNSYYQEEDFFVTAHGHVNVLIPKREMNKYVGWFISSTIKKMFMNKYGFADMCTQKVLKKECISLPIDDNGDPDWIYMEEYMKQVEKKAQCRIEKLL